MVEKKTPMAWVHSEAEDRLSVPKTPGITSEVPRIVPKKLADQLVGSQEREIARLEKLLEETDKMKGEKIITEDVVRKCIAQMNS